MNEFLNNHLVSKDLFNIYNFLGYWIILEKHTSLCTCSYCKDFKSCFAIWIPIDKKRNSWRVIALKLSKYKYYLRLSGYSFLGQV